jgi:hypothetical protein
VAHLREKQLKLLTENKSSDVDTGGSNTADKVPTTAPCHLNYARFSIEQLSHAKMNA